MDLTLKMLLYSYNDHLSQTIIRTSLKSYQVIKVLVTDSRVACPKFGHPALSLQFYNYALNTDFVAAVGILREKITIRKLKPLQKNCSILINAKK